jgi:voltage-gated potassium channel
MRPPKHFLISVALSIIVIAAGTIGYHAIEGWNFLDSIYMTIITIATVGYTEVHALGDAGKAFTIILIFFGMVTTTYVVGSVVQFMVEGRIRVIMGRRRLDREIDRYG